MPHNIRGMLCPVANRWTTEHAIREIFGRIGKKINETANKNQLKDADFMKANAPFVGEVYLGHLRYGTYGSSSSDLCHPFLRQNNWMTRNLVLAGNFNLTNVDELFSLLLDF